MLYKRIPNSNSHLNKRPITQATFGHVLKDIGEKTLRNFLYNSWGRVSVDLIF